MGCVLLWTHLFLLLLLFIVVNSQDANISLGSCQSRCGKVSIPYPFGIGKGCYMNDWFKILCNKSSTSGVLVPYLPKINREVVKIDLPNPDDPEYNETNLYGTLRLKTSITSKGCSNSSDGIEFGEPLNFTGTPFTIGSSNKLVAFGCNNKATLTNLEEPGLVGCFSSCTPAKEGDISSCNGYRCCLADIPGQIGHVIGVKIEDNSENTTTRGGGGCRVAFLTDEFYQSQIWEENPEARSGDPQWFYKRQYVTVQLWWVIPVMNLSFIKSLGCLDKNIPTQSHRYMPCIFHNSTSDGIIDINGMSCRCSNGYRGNPYILGGCKDIDECQGYGLNGHKEHSCVNTLGGFYYVYKKSKTWPIIKGFSVGFGVLIFTVVSFWLYKFIKRQRKINRKKKFFKRNGGLLLQQQLNSSEGTIEKTIVFSSKELEKATENFSLNRVLGQGGQGTVYKGMLVDGRIVAVKKSTVVDEDKLEEFINEVVILSQINHRNIVKILGCCLETQVPLLVYEFIPNGNLFEHLHDESDDYTMATWEVRLRIAIDIAGALSYLHSAASSPIYHRDIKSTNIMLDEKYRAKVSDFGTSRSITVDHTHLTTVVSGTIGYVDPEYFQSSQFTDKSDVYSFGVVLVELITGKKPVFVVRFQENRSLATYFILAMKENRLVDIIDPRIKDDCKQDQVMEAAQLAKRCLNLKGKKRPSMREVSMELERIRSPAGGSQSHSHIGINNVDEVPVGFNIGVESCNNVGVTAPMVLQDNVASTLWLDAQPLFPGQTW